MLKDSTGRIEASLSPVIVKELPQPLRNGDTIVLRNFRIYRELFKPFINISRGVVAKVYYNCGASFEFEPSPPVTNHFKPEVLQGEFEAFQPMFNSTPLPASITDDAKVDGGDVLDGVDVSDIFDKWL